MNLTMKMKKGFTLIELLVVIAIIGILAALIIVSLQGAREKAQDTQRKNNARNIDTALAQFYLDQTPNAYITEAAAVDVTVANLGGATGLGQYLTGTAAFDSTLAKRYITNAGGTTYLQAWQLASKTEQNATSGNGIYPISGTGTVTANALTVDAFTADATLKAFVTFGPQ